MVHLYPGCSETRPTCITVAFFVLPKSKCTDEMRESLAAVRKQAILVEISSPCSAGNFNKFLSLTLQLVDISG